MVAGVFLFAGTSERMTNDTHDSNSPDPQHTGSSELGFVAEPTGASGEAIVSSESVSVSGENGEAAGSRLIVLMFTDLVDSSAAKIELGEVKAG